MLIWNRCNLERDTHVFPGVLLAGLLSLLLFSPVNVSMAAQSADLGDLSIEELANLRITSVSRRSEALSEAPAAVYVIGREEIIRSGVTSIPEALRLAPGVEVARNNADTWSISIRGFNSDLANKLLVLIDGRSVYSPLYAGVFWDVQDVLLEDVERIEVIAGPGGTLWGANAVNGVINIITRSAEDTQGGYVELGGGNEEQVFAGFRYGGQLRNGIDARAYAKHFRRDASSLATGADGVDNWHMSRGGFRLDWDVNESDRVTLQGDTYQGKKGREVLESFTLGTLPTGSFLDEVEMSGANLLGRWTRDMESGSNLKLQVYYDYTSRDIPNAYAEDRNTFDVDFQHRFNSINRNDIVWGAGFRLTSDELDNSIFSSFEPDSRTDLTFSLFVQDKINLWDGKLFLTLGSKFEHNDYTGFEFQPNARLSWLVTERQTLWGSVSRAVRIPSRLDVDLKLTVPGVLGGFPLYTTINGNDDFDTEELIAYEIGYRLQAQDNLTFDLAAFYNDYDKLQTIEAGTLEPVIDPPFVYLIFPTTLDNGMEGETYGGTFAANWEPVSSWRLQFQYTFLDLQLHRKPGSLDTGSPVVVEGNSPENQFSLHSYLDLPYDLSFYTGFRFVDNLPNRNIESYTALDVSFRWRPVEDVEMSITGRNLLDKNRSEFTVTNEVERSIYGKVTWRF